LRPFDISLGLIDRIRAELVVERKPEREYLEIKSAGPQLVSGIFPDGWMTDRGTLLLKRPAEATPLFVKFFLPPQAPARQVRVFLDDRVVAEHTYEGPGQYTLITDPLFPPSDPAITITVDRTFTAPPDQRKLGILLIEAGFRP
jgi:hypothetical protein